MTEIFINNVVVDLDKDMIMSLNFAIADILDPEKRNTNFSKTLKLPGTKINNKLFGHIFEIGKEISSYDSLVNFTVDFNPNLKATCKIFQENLLQFNGIVQLMQVNRLNEKYEYEVVVYGALRNLITSFEGLKLEDINLSKYDHTFNRARMKESWDTKIQRNGIDYVNFIAGNPTGEGYVYPTIDYGYTQSPININIVNSYPAVYVREYLFNMFNNAGFTWTSEFIDSDFFKRLIIPHNEKNALLTSAEIDRRSFRATTTVDFLGSGKLTGSIGSNNIRVSFDNDSTAGNYDISNVYIADGPPAIQYFYPPTGFGVGQPATFNVSKKGTYIISTSINFTVAFFNQITLLPQTAKGRINISIIKIKSGVHTTVASTGNYDFQATTGGGIFNIETPAIFIDVNDIFYVSIYFEYFALTNQELPTANYILHSGSSFQARAVSIPIVIGDTMFLSSSIPKDITQKDFFLSVIKMFNLYVQPDPDNDGNLLIETLVDFYEGNSIIEWTKYIDYGKEILIKPISSIEGKDYIYKYKDDTDFYNKDYKDIYGVTYGERNISIANDFLKGQKKIELIFAPTPSFGIVQNEMVIPRIVDLDIDTGAVKPIKSIIRILYYGGVLSAGGSWKWKSHVSSFTETTYAYAGHLDHPFLPTLDLLFAPPKLIYWGAPSNIGQNYTSNNLFNKYWLQFIEEITDKNSKIVTMSIRLRPSDIFRLNFKNFIHIDGINYRLNKVIDYNPTKEGVCKVELCKIKRGFTFIPYNEDLSGATSQDPTQFDLVEGGENEVRSLSAISFIQLIDGSKNTVIGISGLSVPILNGGKN